ncbi:MAG: hypothetical protein DMG64_00800 [Acidobacteria bacterium]|nr:MAG: hypothetical protein DMG63_12285 [Acidobacteriota bacterium]PYY06622.1 MAG: hypothetical protein DMG64_00800 [Acidobacteriota bacterium]PYY22578.1 MAG: hypothetical protein DMG62_12685 [Acidobacteriota bacterium]
MSWAFISAGLCNGALGGIFDFHWVEADCQAGVRARTLGAVFGTLRFHIYPITTHKQLLASQLPGPENAHQPRESCLEKY